MKLKVIRHLLFLILLLNPAIAFAADWCADGNMAAAYLNDDTSGGLVDCTSNSNDMTDTGSAGNYASTGTFDEAFDFTQTNNAGMYVTDNASIQNIRVISVGAWTAPDDQGAGDGTQCGSMILSKVDSSSDGWNFGLDNDTAPNEFCFQYQWTGGTAKWLTTTDPVTFTPSYQHLAVTYDSGSTSNDPVFYYNGSSQSLTESNSPSSSPDDDTGGALCQGIKCTNGGVATTGEYDGDIDEPYVYTTSILSSTDVNDIMDNGLAGAAAGGGFTPKTLLITHNDVVHYGNGLVLYMDKNSKESWVDYVKFAKN